MEGSVYALWRKETMQVPVDVISLMSVRVESRHCSLGLSGSDFDVMSETIATQQRVSTCAWAAMLLALLLVSGPGCATLGAPKGGSLEGDAAPTSLRAQVEALGPGLAFLNVSPPQGAASPEVGAAHVYARSYSANARLSPVGVEIWVFDAQERAVHGAHSAYLEALYATIYGWDPEAWADSLAATPEAAAILRTKSDLFWESLAQQVAERVFNASITPALYRFGPTCMDSYTQGCVDAGISEAMRVVVRTYLDGRRDPMNPVTRSITYMAERGSVDDPELIFELQVPEGLRVAGPRREELDFRPRIAGRQDRLEDIRLWAHLPAGVQPRRVNTDYPDYNLLFVPLRHLVLQGEVHDPNLPGSIFDYPSLEAFVAQAGALIATLRSAEGGAEVAQALRPFLSDRYYGMFTSGGQGVAAYRDYILGERAGVARGLNPDFGLIELSIGDEVVATWPTD